VTHAPPLNADSTSFKTSLPQVTVQLQSRDLKVVWCRASLISPGLVRLSLAQWRVGWAGIMKSPTRWRHLVDPGYSTIFLCLLRRLTLRRVVVRPSVTSSELKLHEPPYTDLRQPTLAVVVWQIITTILTLASVSKLVFLSVFVLVFSKLFGWKLTDRISWFMSRIPV
jgi:hypothetical protein